MHGPSSTKFSFDICFRGEAPVPGAAAVCFGPVLVHNGAKLKFADSFFIIYFAELAKETHLIKGKLLDGFTKFLHFCKVCRKELKFMV